MPVLDRALAAAALAIGLAQCTVTEPGGLSPVRTALVSDDGPVSADAVQLVNQLRKEQGLMPLRRDPALQRIATVHVRDMEANDFIGHTGSDGRGLRARGQQQGYRACWIGENVASGQRSAPEVVEDWRASPSHRRIMLHPRAVEYGLARGAADAWALVVAQPGCV